ncbi:hypothetical protein GD1_218 [Paraglaciecola Antarctic GD virus 1]|nr:hypothetical protein GD1_218 [Paraglaciecola Antarctic GD virus 1]
MLDTVGLWWFPLAYAMGIIITGKFNWIKSVFFTDDSEASKNLTIYALTMMIRGYHVESEELTQRISFKVAEDIATHLYNNNVKIKNEGKR